MLNFIIFPFIPQLVLTKSPQVLEAVGKCFTYELNNTVYYKPSIQAELMHIFVLKSQKLYYTFKVGQEIP